MTEHAWERKKVAEAERDAFRQALAEAQQQVALAREAHGNTVQRAARSIGGHRKRGKVDPHFLCGVVVGGACVLLFFLWWLA